MGEVIEPFGVRLGVVVPHLLQPRERHAPSAGRGMPGGPASAPPPAPSGKVFNIVAGASGDTNPQLLMRTNAAGRGRHIRGASQQQISSTCRGRSCHVFRSPVVRGARRRVGG